MMSVLEQHIEQLLLLVKSLQKNLEILLHKGNDSDIQTAIYLHCAMILFYQKFLRILRANTMKEYLVELLDTTNLKEKNVCQNLFNHLNIKYKFTTPSHLSSEKLCFMLQFTTVVLSEAQNLKNELETKKANISARANIFFACCILTAILTKVLMEFPTLLAPSLLINFLLISTFVFLIGAVIFFLQATLIDKRNINLSHLFRPFFNINNATELDKEIRRNKDYIYAAENYDVPPIPDVLVKNECGKGTFRVVPSLFFKLDNSLMFVQDELMSKSP